MPTPRLLSDRYEIVRRLRVGRLVQVYEGVDHRDERTVAIELLRDVPGNDKAVVARFKRAARTAAKLSHPRIARVTAAAEAQGVAFVVRELVEEQCLRDLVSSQGQLEPGQATTIAIEICEGLELAHQREVLHGCLTPSDVLLTKDGHVQLTGFGIAGSIGAVDAVDVRYRAPEQAHGPGDPRSDLYALGCCLYEMLLGRPPFQGDPQLSDRLGARTPAELAAVVLRLLAEQPEDRYDDAATVRGELSRYWTKVAPATGEQAAYARPATTRLRDGAILVGSFLLLAGGVVAAATKVDIGSEPIVDGDEEGEAPYGSGDPSRPTGAGVTKSGPGSQELAAGELTEEELEEEDEPDGDDEEEGEDADEEGEGPEEGGGATISTPGGTTSTSGDGVTSTTTGPGTSSTTSPTTTQPAPSPVPGVVGMAEGQARNTLAAHNLSMVVVERVRVYNTSQDGVVLSQSPTGGSARPADGTVRVRVGRWCLLIC